MDSSAGTDSRHSERNENNTSKSTEMDSEKNKSANSPEQSGSATDSGVEVTSPSTQSPDSASSSPQASLQTELHSETSGQSTSPFPNLASFAPNMKLVSEFEQTLTASESNDMKNSIEPSESVSPGNGGTVSAQDDEVTKSYDGEKLVSSTSVASQDDSGTGNKNDDETAGDDGAAAMDENSSAKPSSLNTVAVAGTSTDPSAGASGSSAKDDEELQGAVGGVAKQNSTSSPSHDGEVSSTYYVKWITFNKTRVPIITQNENGPCPLLALMNILLLKGKIQLTPIVEMVTSKQLMDQLGEYVLTNTPKNLDAAHLANYEQNVQDAISLMHKLQTGLDVNVRFTGASDFEYTSECIIFDLLEISLYHGWLLDPQDADSVAAVGKDSYNQLVEKIIHYKQSEKDDQVREALIAEQFLDRTASQLTYHGLCELSSTVKDQELCVFFRNNHFSTLYKHNSELFLLVTDQGFLTESNVVWETLSNVDGDCHFVDANFCTYTKPPPPSDPIPASPYTTGDEQINSDYQVALSLQQQDQQLIAEQEAAWGQYQKELGAGGPPSSDHELAVRLQEEEDRQAAAAINQQRQQQAQGQGQPMPPGADRNPREERRDRKEGKDCVIL